MFDKIRSTKAYHRYFGPDGDGGGDPSGEPKEVVLLPVRDDSGRTVYKSAEGVSFFTQEHLNQAIGTARVEARKKIEGEKSALQQTLESVKKEAEEKGMNVDALSAKITELEEATMTAEELGKKRAKDLETQFTTERDQLKKQVDHFQGMFREERISTEIAGACAAHKAISVETLAPLIRAHTELVEERDRKGVVLGYKAVVHFTDKDDEGNPVVRDLPIPDAVKRMREMTDRFGHLFFHESESGTGASTLYGQSKEQANGGPTSGDQASFDKWAAQQGI